MFFFHPKDLHEKDKKKFQKCSICVQKASWVPSRLRPCVVFFFLHCFLVCISEHSKSASSKHFVGRIQKKHPKWTEIGNWIQNRCSNLNLSSLKPGLVKLFRTDTLEQWKLRSSTSWGWKCLPWSSKMHHDRQSQKEVPTQKEPPSYQLEGLLKEFKQKAWMRMKVEGRLFQSRKFGKQWCSHGSKFVITRKRNILQTVLGVWTQIQVFWVGQSNSARKALIFSLVGNFFKTADVLLKKLASWFLDKEPAIMGMEMVVVKR